MSRYVFGFLSLAGCLVIGVSTIAVAEPPSSRAQEKIRQALDGELPSGATGDGMLDDVIGIINQRGSILDGSSLDPRRREDQGNPVIAKSKRAHAAEQLLKAARLLERLEAGDQDRADLVNKIRAEAVKLLLD